MPFIRNILKNQAKEEIDPADLETQKTFWINFVIPHDSLWLEYWNIFTGFMSLISVWIGLYFAACDFPYETTWESFSTNFHKNREANVAVIVFAIHEFESRSPAFQCLQALTSKPLQK